MTFLVESDCANRIRERLVSPQRFSLIKPFFSLGCPEGIFLFFRGRATRSWKKTNSRSQPKDFTGDEPTSSLSNHRPMSDSAICHQLRRGPYIPDRRQSDRKCQQSRMDTVLALEIKLLPLATLLCIADIENTWTPILFASMGLRFARKNDSVY